MEQSTVGEGPVLVTGAAGFIGFHLSRVLLARGDRVIGVDCVNDYYDPALKRARLEILNENEGFDFHEIDIADAGALGEVFEGARPARGVNLAAQAGVRYSLTHPEAYVHSNLVGFANILEASRRHDVGHLVYASSSSVYGGTKELPFHEGQNVDHPLSLYAASKKSNELMAHVYSHLFRLPTTGLRFFTVYGPWGRPDMALFLFTKAILAGEPIKVFNHGDMTRDFTYVDDIVEGVVRVLDRPPCVEETPLGPYRLFNIGNNAPVKLMDMIGAVEEALGREAVKTMLPIQPGDVPATYADVAALERVTGFRPQTPLRDGIARFVDWYRRYYDIEG